MNGRYARLTDEQKAQRNAKRRENYARKKAGVSEQVKFPTDESKDEHVQGEPAQQTCNMTDPGIGNAVNASCLCR